MRSGAASSRPVPPRLIVRESSAAADPSL